MKTWSERPKTRSASHEWERAISLLTAAIRKADPAKNLDKANLARYNLAFCYYMNKQYYEADVLAEHLRPPLSPGRPSAKSTEIGMQAWADAYSTYTEIDRLERPEPPDRPGELHRRDLARQRAGRRRPDEPRADLPGHGPVRQGDQVLGAVRRRSNDWVERRTAWEVATGPRAATWTGGATPRAPRPKPRRRSTS